MTAPKPVEGRTWKGHRHSLVVEGGNPDDDGVLVSVYAPHDGPGVVLTPQQAREVSKNLLRRADRLDRPTRKVNEIPRTPGEVVRNFLASAKWSTEVPWDDSEPPMMTYARYAHIVDSFSVVVLMTELERLDPARAAEVARRLGDYYEDGEVIDDLIHQWTKDREQGKPIGFDPPETLPLEVDGRG